MNRQIILKLTGPQKISQPKQSLYIGYKEVKNAKGQVHLSPKLGNSVF